MVSKTESELQTAPEPITWPSNLLTIDGELTTETLQQLSKLEERLLQDVTFEDIINQLSSLKGEINKELNFAHQVHDAPRIRALLELKRQVDTAHSRAYNREVGITIFIVAILTTALLAWVIVKDIYVVEMLAAYFGSMMMLFWHFNYAYESKRMSRHMINDRKKIQKHLVRIKTKKKVQRY